MSELTHDRKYRYQNYHHMMTRNGNDAWADAMMDLMGMVGRLEADNADLRAKLDAVPVMAILQLTKDATNDAWSRKTLNAVRSWLKTQPVAP